MADPLSIAGLTIAVLDDLIKLGMFTAELVENVKAFEDDTRRLHKLIESDTSRTQLLKTLLFTDLPIYGGQTLFSQFSDDVQRQTSHLLEDSKSTLQAAHDLLRRRYGEGSSTSTPSTPTPSLNISSKPSSFMTIPTRPRNKSSSSFSAAILWSVRDKKRVENELVRFAQANLRIEQNVKLWCLANDLGVNIHHLKRLQDDDSSKKLGFDADAALRLAQQDALSSCETLMLDGTWTERLLASKDLPRAGSFYTMEMEGSTYILENHAYQPPGWTAANGGHLDNTGLDARSRKRVEALARLLHQPKEIVFRIPSCVGWRYLRERGAVTFVFEINPSPKAPPKTLLDLLYRRDGTEALTPSLGERFQLAAALASCLAQLHMVSWLHESLRSENIIFFPVSADNGGTDPKTSLDFGSPWVLGFEFSRLDEAMTVAHVDFIPERDIYRHPQRQGHPEVSFRRIHDIYSLGVILLEIGLWQPAISLQKDAFAGATQENVALVQKQLLKHATHRLEKKVGAKYRDVVVKCLQGDFGVVDDNREDLKLQQSFRAQVVEVLERAADAV